MMCKHLVLLLVLSVVPGLVESRVHTEHSVVNVYVEHQMNTMVMVTRSTCFILLLTSEELHEVETFRGRETLMIHVMRDVVGFVPERPVPHSDRGLTDQMHRWCDTRTILLLERPPSVPTTSAQPTSSNPTSSVSTPYTQPTSSNPTSSIPTPAATNPPATPGSTNQTYPTTSITASTVLYDRTLSVKAVIVTKDGCYVYRLSDTDKNLIALGPQAQDMFEHALLAKDRTTSRLTDITGEIGYMAANIQNSCAGTVYLLP